MIQNHTMQLPALTAMEPPVSLDPEAIRDEKVKLFKAIKPLDFDYERSDVVRAQYKEGLVDGEKVEGYRQTEGVSLESEIETYASLRLNIRNWRWEGVPFYLRSGKPHMSCHGNRDTIQGSPSTLFSENEMFNLASNSLVFQIQPDEGSTVLLNAKIPGLQNPDSAGKNAFQVQCYTSVLISARGLRAIGSRCYAWRRDAFHSWRRNGSVLEIDNPAPRILVERGAERNGVLCIWFVGALGLGSPLWDNGHQWRRP